MSLIWRWFQLSFAERFLLIMLDIIMTGHHYHGQLLVVYNSQIDSDRVPHMRKLTIMGVAIFFMNENKSYPSPDRDSSQSFCVWFDEKGQYWLDVYFQREWRRASSYPFADFEEVFEAVKTYM